MLVSFQAVLYGEVPLLFGGFIVRRMAETLGQQRSQFFPVSDLISVIGMLDTAGLGNRTITYAVCVAS